MQSAASYNVVQDQLDSQKEILADLSTMSSTTAGDVKNMLALASNSSHCEVILERIERVLCNVENHPNILEYKIPESMKARMEAQEANMRLQAARLQALTFQLETISQEDISEVPQMISIYTPPVVPQPWGPDGASNNDFLLTFHSLGKMTRDLVTSNIEAIPISCASAFRHIAKLSQFWLTWYLYLL